MATFPRYALKDSEIVTIGGLELAGRMRSLPETPEWKLDQQSSGGMTGAIWIFQGYKCAEFALPMYCIGSMDWEKFDAFVSAYGPDDGKIKPKVLPIINGQLNRKGVGIRKGFVRKISSPQWSETDETWTYTVQIAHVVDVKIKRPIVLENKYENGLIDPGNRFAKTGEPSVTPSTQKTAPPNWMQKLQGQGLKR